MPAITRHGRIAYLLAAAVIVVDQLTKYWVLHSLHLQDRGSIEVLGPLHFSMVWNTGVSFGLFRADMEWMRWALAAFSLGVAIFLAVWARKAGRPLLGVAIGLVMGGALGNLIDRVRLGAVVDFIDVQRLMFPWVFNVADSAITIGVILLLLDSLMTPDKPKAAA